MPSDTAIGAPERGPSPYDTAAAPCEVANFEARLAVRDHETRRRLRNMLAMIRSIIRQTGEGAETIEAYRGQLEGRVAAFTRVQALLLADGENGVDLFNLVADEALLAGLPHDAITQQGESVRISAGAGGLFALLVHELVQLALSAACTPPAYPLASMRCRLDPDAVSLHIDWLQQCPLPQDLPEAAPQWIEDALAYELGAQIAVDQQGDRMLRRYCLPAIATVANPF